MLRLTLHQMRSGWARLLAAGIAIALGTGFVAASLLAGNVLSSATSQSVTAQYRGADLVVSGIPLAEDTVDLVARTDGITATHLIARTGVEIGHESRTEWMLIGVSPAQQSMMVGALDAGSLPTTDRQIALTGGTATRLGVEIGDTVTAYGGDWSSDGDAAPAAGSGDSDPFTVTGLIADATNFFNYYSDGLVTERAIRALSPDAADNGELTIALADGADRDRVAEVLRTELGSGATIRTVDQVADATIASISGGANPLTALLLAFSGIALVVAVLVIGNTFSVLVAQRTRLLALLRTIGATRSQVRRSVLLEATLLGVLAAGVGLALGYGVVAGAIAFLAPMLSGVDLWRGAGLSPTVAIVTLVVGIAVTLIAGWVPSRAATRVKPLAALRPEPVELGSTAGKVRAAVAIAAVVLGGALLVGGILWAGTIGGGPGLDGNSDDILLLSLAMGILGGFLSVFGVLFGAAFVINGAVRLAGTLFGRGATARIAVENSLRNPRRTAATTNALFIGVALVVLMSTGAATAKATFDKGLADYFPVDLHVAAVDGRALTPAQVDAAQRIDGITAVTMVAGAQVQLTPNPASTTSDDVSVELLAPDNAAALRDPTLVTDLGPGRIAVDAGKASILGAVDGDTVQAHHVVDQLVEEGAEPPGTDVTVARIIPGGNLAITLPETLALLAPDTPHNQMWLRVDVDANALTVVRSLQDALSDVQAVDPASPLLSVEGTAVERATFSDVIDTMLLVVIALLAVAVVIALVGVANTLSLSVIERRRESATLRALGLTKKQLRVMLGVEGVLIALVGTAVGVLAGLGYGWAGSWILLSAVGEVQLMVPWVEIGAVVVIAVLAGLVASVLPSRSAVKVPPVAALAEE